ncbi:MAG: glycoside hydrolase family 9 protein [Campylobacterales bacterium]|nr:glycoside hydrolase family 9 protein [Campylobacterales bacterium]
MKKVVSLALVCTFALSSEINLSKGWNLISLGDDNNLSNTQEIDEKYKNANVVWKYNNGWIVHSKNEQIANLIQNSPYATMQNIYNNEGFWVYNSVDENISVSDGFSTPTLGSDAWQLVGVSQDTDIQQFFEQNSDVDLAWVYEDNKWLVYADDVSASYETFSVVKKAQGVWIHKTATNTESNDIEITSQIKIDQFGYLPNMQKVAIISVPKLGFNAGEYSKLSDTLEVRDKLDDSVVFESSAVSYKDGAVDADSGDEVYRFDFTELKKEGEYYIYDKVNKVASYSFKISNSVYDDVLKQAMKTFFYQRAGFAKQTPFADEKWVDGASHLGVQQDSDARLINPSDPYISDANTSKDLSGGWYDAGDFNKYVTYADGALHELLFAYEQNKNIFCDDTNIPESNNTIPDILDEVKYELDWLLKMQLEDGSVIHKVASIEWDDVSPPSTDAIYRRYSSTSASATISLAGVMAHSAIVFKDIDANYSDKLKTSAIKAWQYMMTNEDFILTDFDNDGFVNAAAKDSLTDRRKNLLNAAIYLYLLTQDESYHEYIKANISVARIMSDDKYLQYDAMDEESQNSLLYYTKGISVDENLSSNIKNNYIYGLSNPYVDFAPLKQARDDIDGYGSYIDAYYWGSNRAKSHAGSVLINSVVYDLDVNETEIKGYAQNYLHYVHGLNPLAKVYLSNASSLGAKNSVDEFYHMWFSDNTIYDNVNTSYGPPPAYLVGGANSYYESDDVYMPSSSQLLMDQPNAKSYKDFNDIEYLSYMITENSITYQAAYIRLLSTLIKNYRDEDFVSEQKIKSYSFDSDLDGWGVSYSGACEVSLDANSSLLVSSRSHNYDGAFVDVTNFLKADTLYVIRADMKRGGVNSDSYNLMAKISSPTPVYRLLNRITVSDDASYKMRAFASFTQSELDAGVSLYINSGSYKDNYYIQNLEIVQNTLDATKDESESIIKISSSNIVDPQGDAMRLKGINLVAYDDDSDALTFMNYSYYNYDKDDFYKIKALGFNSVRVALWYKYFETDMGFEWLDTIISWAKEAGVYVVLDMHAPDGGGFQGPDNTTVFWDDTVYQNSFVELWKQIASRYKNNSTVAAYDLLNEPCPHTQSSYITLMKNTIDAIRVIDKNHIINVEQSFSDDNEPFILDGYENILYDFHFYDPWSFTSSQDTIYNSSNINDTVVENIFREYADFYDGYLFHVSEFGQMRDFIESKNSSLWLEKVYELLDEYGASYHYWNYKGSVFGLYDGVNAFSQNSPYSQTLEDIFIQNNGE